MSESESICSTCGKPLNDDQPYASMGGNWVPYVAAKLYHIKCIPTIGIVTPPKDDIFGDSWREMWVGMRNFISKCVDN